MASDHVVISILREFIMHQHVAVNKNLTSFQYYIVSILQVCLQMYTCSI
jgi:hypothetical protein